MLKDSYTNVLAPWLIESYKNVILVDPRIFDGDFQMILDKYSPDEVLVVNYIFTTVFRIIVICLKICTINKEAVSFL